MGAVIHDGTIMQVGQVIDIFEKPESLFVANFVNMKNVIPISFIAENQANPGPVLAKSLGSHEYLGIRPEKIRISHLPLERDFVMLGIIDRIKDAGVYLQIDVSYRKYSFQVILTPNYYDGPLLQAGSEIYLGFDEADLCFIV